METLGSVHTRHSYFHPRLPIPEMPTWRKNKTSKEEILENSEQNFNWQCPLYLFVGLDDANDEISGDMLMRSGGDEQPKRAIGGGRPGELRAQKSLSPAGAKSETVPPPISQSRLLQGRSHNLNPANHLTISHSDSNYLRTRGSTRAFVQAFYEMLFAFVGRRSNVEKQLVLGFYTLEVFENRGRQNQKS